MSKWLDRLGIIGASIYILAVTGLWIADAPIAHWVALVVGIGFLLSLLDHRPRRSDP